MSHPFEALDPATYDLPPAIAARVQTPALVVHAPRVRRNVARVIGLLGGEPDRWRPHVKTTKIPEVWEVLAAAGVRHFKCATTREAAILLETLAGAGVDGDVLLAHPLRGPGLARLGEIAAAHPGARVSVLCEDGALVADVPAAVGVFVDLNPGMDRTGLPLEARREIRAVVDAAGARLRGLHYYDGHHHEADPADRRARVRAGYVDLAELVEELRGRGARIEEVVTAGTPAFLAAAEENAVSGLPDLRHRLSPGTVVFHDARSAEQTPALELEPAAVVLTRVVSWPGPDRVTCDAGSKSVAAEAGDPIARVIGRPELLAEAPSEEHLPLRVLRGPRPERGTLLHLAPHHVCPTVNLAEEALWVDGDDVRVVRVAARAHELLAP